MKRYRRIYPILFVIFILFLYSCKGKDIIVEDFEGSDYGSWTRDGNAFGNAPVILNFSENQFPQQRWIDLNRKKLGFIKKGIINTSITGKGLTGKLTSPDLTVNRKYLVFLYTSGQFPDEVGVNILLNGKIVKSLTGTGSSNLEWRYFDLKDLKGKDIQIQLIDLLPDQRGSMQADHFYLSNDLPVTDKTLELQITGKYLNLPVRTGDPVKRIKITVDNEVIDDFSIELADSFPQFYVFIDLEKYKDSKVIITSPSIEKTSNAFEFISLNDTIIGSEDLYKEKLRQQIHFSAIRGWNNDPNGLVYYAGVYHLFFQHNPYGWAWGNMHWGHATSKDLVHWKEAGEAIYPDSLGTIFSGSGIVDLLNSANLSTTEQRAIICFYTAAGNTSPESINSLFTQCIAFSIDSGHTWTKYEKNPVLPHIIAENRDPKVIWYAKEQKWIMALFLDKNSYALFSSPDLKKWERLCDIEIPGTSECPEFFEIPVNGNPKITKWIFYGGNGRYLIGKFNGSTFTPEYGPYQNNYGNCFYASQTYNNIPEEDGRRIQIGWGQVASPGMPFNQCMLFPTQLTLRNTMEGLRLFTEPVKEIELLHKQEWKREALSIDPGTNPISGVSGELYHIKGDFKIGKNSQIGFLVHGTEVIFDKEKGELTCGDRKVECEPDNGKIFFEIIADRNTIEIFLNHGSVYMPIARDLSKDYGLELVCRNEKVVAENLQIFELNSIWN